MRSWHIVGSDDRNPCNLFILVFVSDQLSYRGSAFCGRRIRSFFPTLHPNHSDCYDGIDPIHVGDSMMPQLNRVLRIASYLTAAVAILLLARTLHAHAILKETSPAANSTVAGPDVPVKLKFNVRIDAARSKLQLLHPDNSVTDLAIEKQSTADTLATKAPGLKPGAYKIRWQVLAPDGHITRGEIPFNVAGS